MSNQRDFDSYSLHESRIYDTLGAHFREVLGVHGVWFAVWAPNAASVSVVGDFNQWDGGRNYMTFHPNSGVWETFIADLSQDTVYKYEIQSKSGNYFLKADPVGFYHELRPETASRVRDINQYQWQDADWMANRQANNKLDAPISVYEVHPLSWRRKVHDGILGYREWISQLIPYVKQMGFTHIELMPITEHPFDGSWGYQVTGFFAPTSRFGWPDLFMEFVDECHRAGIGVILDWVPGHFVKDAHGLGRFDGTALYEHADSRRGEHPTWGTYIFNFERDEVQQFLLSNALFWLDKYHIDGLRVDAVASMLYLNFGREDSDWLPNEYGGNENLGAIQFLKTFNEQVHKHFPSAITIAEESTEFPDVTKPVYAGGLGFDYKWNMGWMNDTLDFFALDPLFRRDHFGQITFSLVYAFNEQFMLPLSHDEVVHLKRSIVDKMPGDLWQKFANTRLLYGYMFGHPGKKLLFQGGEFGQWAEWDEKKSLDWHLLAKEPKHGELQAFVTELNGVYGENRPLFSQDYSWDGFQWLIADDAANSVLAWLRWSDDDTFVLVVCNFTPEVRYNYHVGVPHGGAYRELLNSDDERFGGSGLGNGGDGSLTAVSDPLHNHPYRLHLTLPPLSCLYITPT